MIPQVIFSPEAEDDLRVSYNWYEGCNPGLGDDFLGKVKARVKQIQKHPEMYPVAKGNCRRALLERFPFEIFYSLEREALYVYAVFHCSQDPAKWKRRVR